jgi:TPR repeat protein
VSKLSLSLICGGLLLLGMGTNGAPAVAQPAAETRSDPCPVYFGVSICEPAVEPGPRATFKDVGNIKPGTTPWYNRLAAGSGSLAQKRFGVSLRDLERSEAPFAGEEIYEQICADNRETCLKDLNDAAERGDPFALSVRVLRLMGSIPPDAPEDQRIDAIAAAVSDLETAAETGFPFAQMMLGSLLVSRQSADFVGVDVERGSQRLKDAIAQRWGGAGWAIVFLTEDEPDLVSILPDRAKSLELAAERNVPAAQFELGLRLLWGHGSEVTADGSRRHRATLRNNSEFLNFTLPRDNQRGFSLIAKAADAGEESAQLVLGRILKTGMFEPYGERITPPDMKRAYWMFEECKTFECELQAAYMLFSGQGVKQDKAGAIRIIEKVASTLAQVNKLGSVDLYPPRFASLLATLRNEGQLLGAIDSPISDYFYQ